MIFIFVLFRFNKSINFTTAQLHSTKPELRFKSCTRRVRDSRWWGSLAVVPAGNKVKRLLLVNHTRKRIHHHHHYRHHHYHHHYHHYRHHHHHHKSFLLIRLIWKAVFQKWWWWSTFTTLKYKGPILIQS